METSFLPPPASFTCRWTEREIMRKPVHSATTETRMMSARTMSAIATTWLPDCGAGGGTGGRGGCGVVAIIPPNQFSVVRCQLPSTPCQEFHNLCGGKLDPTIETTFANHSKFPNRRKTTETDRRSMTSKTSLSRRAASKGERN